MVAGVEYGSGERGGNNREMDNKEKHVKRIGKYINIEFRIP